MKKVLQVVESLSNGGTEAFVMNHYRRIDRSKIQYDFLLADNKYQVYEDEARALGANVFYCKNPSLGTESAFIQSVVEIINKHGPYDIIHAHSNLANTWVMYAARKAGIKVRISHSHAASGQDTNNLISGSYFKLEKYFLRKSSSLFLACSNEAGKYLYGESFWKRNGYVFKNGIDVSKFVSATRRQSLIKEFNIEPNNYVFGNITRYDDNKNMDFLLDVFAQLLKTKENCILLLGGAERGKLQYLKEKAKILNVESKVRFIGERQDVQDCLKLMDIYLFPSIKEGLGIALLEAQAAGLKCVASTGVPQEADVGAGLVEFVELENGCQKWVDTILNNIDYTKPTSDEIMLKFKESGFDVNETTRVLESIYLSGQVPHKAC